jgi:hypothetical protein
LRSGRHGLGGRVTGTAAAGCWPLHIVGQFLKCFEIKIENKKKELGKEEKRAKKKSMKFRK